MVTKWYPKMSMNSSLFYMGGDYNKAALPEYHVQVS